MQEIISATVPAGTTFDIACRRAKDWAFKSGQMVEFDFNGLEVWVSSETDLALLKRDFSHSHLLGWSRIGPNPKPELSEDENDLIHRLQEQRQKEQEAYEAQQRERTATELARIALRFPDGGNLSELLGWLKSYTQIADSIYAPKVYSAWLHYKLEEAGYISSEMAGLRSRWYEENQEVLGFYIVGQAMNCLESGMPPHPILGDFVDRYNAL